MILLVFYVEKLVDVMSISVSITRIDWVSTIPSILRTFSVIISTKVSMSRPLTSATMSYGPNTL